MFDKNLLIGFLAGAAVGALGIKFYNEHKDEIGERLNKAGFFKDGPAEEGAAAAPAEGAKDELSLEELMAQKERLEDLIAEYQSRYSTPANGQ